MVLQNGFPASAGIENQEGMPSLLISVNNNTRIEYTAADDVRALEKTTGALRLNAHPLLRSLLCVSLWVSLRSIEEFFLEQCLKRLGWPGPSFSTGRFPYKNDQLWLGWLGVPTFLDNPK